MRRRMLWLGQLGQLGSLGQSLGTGQNRPAKEMGLRLCIARKAGHVDLAIATVDVRIDVVRYRKGVQVNPCTGLKILGTE